LAKLLRVADPRSANMPTATLDRTLCAEDKSRTATIQSSCPPDTLHSAKVSFSYLRMGLPAEVGMAVLGLPKAGA